MTTYHGQGADAVPALADLSYWHAGIRGEQYFHRFETPVGTVEERREWLDVSFSWPIVHHMIQRVEDLWVIRYVFEWISYEADWDLFRRMDVRISELGLPLCRCLVPTWVS